MAHDDDCWWQHNPEAPLGTTGEHDDYRRWIGTRGYQVELAALLIANRYGSTGMPGHPLPNGDDYRLATQIVEGLTGRPAD